MEPAARGTDRRAPAGAAVDGPGVGRARHGDLAANVVGFCRLLRRRGLQVGAQEAADALRALRAVDLSDRREAYLALRAVLASGPEAQRIFDAAFWEFWGAADEQRRPSGGLDATGLSPDGHQALERVVLEWQQEDADAEGGEEVPAYSPVEVVTRKDFSTFSADELEEITAVVCAIARRVATRLSRRTRTARRGHLVDLRRTMRASLRRGGEVMEIVRRERRLTKTRVVLLCDVSGSMDLYSRFLIQFIYALQHAVGRVETFVFSTGLSRITGSLARDDIHAALDDVARHVPDWSGGTKIGRSLRRFLDEYGGKVLDGRTVVIIISDGWDTGEIDLLEAAMAELRRRAARVIWLNPLLASPGYEPICQGMRVALPFVDIFAPAHNLESLRQLERYLARR
ncbi:MAG: VWA domain-containing protein [Armatimonadota bacterium]|nr:VWA domain-containing protein [Armatimonadota bacterium]MDR7519883.1 VWA domain-containing protein [Armatimonadota bacterium]MDR7550531.1 VWA domain-containing protein [Armatimonadota bacterium]